MRTTPARGKKRDGKQKSVELVRVETIAGILDERAAHAERELESHEN
jgi:hypothetical protein